jgi:hypothetical protein
MKRLMDESYLLCWEDTEWCARALELLFAILSISSGNAQAVRGIARDFVDFLRNEKGPRRPASMQGVGG